MRDDLKLKKGPDYTFKNLVKKTNEARKKVAKKEKSK